MRANITRRQALGAGALGLTAFTLAACRGGDGGSEAGGPTVLQFWTHTHDPMNVLNERLIEEYEAANDVRIEYTVMPNADFFTRMLTAMSTGAGPDVINMSDTLLRGDYIAKGLVAPLDPAAFGVSNTQGVIDKYVPGTLAAGQGEDGTLYGVPSEFNATAFAINASHYADAGLDPAAPPATWEEVIEHGKALNAAGHDNAFSFPYTHAATYTQQMQMLLHQTGGSILGAAGDGTGLSEPNGLAAVQLWADLARSGISDPNKVTRDANAPMADFQDGRQSMAVVYPWSMGQIADTNPDTYAQLQLAPLPQVDPSSPKTRASGYFWSVNAQSDVIPEGWKFVAFLASHHEDWLREASFVQPVVGWETSEPAQEIDFIDVWVDAYAGSAIDEVGPHWAEVQDAVLAMINDVVFNNGEIAPAAEAATVQIQSALSS